MRVWKWQVRLRRAQHSGSYSHGTIRLPRRFERFASISLLRGFTASPHNEAPSLRLYAFKLQGQSCERRQAIFESTFSVCEVANESSYFSPLEARDEMSSTNLRRRRFNCILSLSFHWAKISATNRSRAVLPFFVTVTSQTRPSLCLALSRQNSLWDSI